MDKSKQPKPQKLPQEFQQYVDKGYKEIAKQLLQKLKEKKAK